MPRIAKELSPLEVNRLTTLGVHAVGSVIGLCLHVSKSANSAPGPLARSWLLRIKVGNRRREFGLGSFPTVTLAMAREKARAMRERIAAGVDPVAEKRGVKSALAAAAAAAVTFEKVAEEWWAKKKEPTLTGKKSDQPIRDVRRLAYPTLGALIIRDVSTAHVLSVVEPIWTTRNPTATKLRGNLEQVFAYATSKGLRDGENPARLKGHLDQVLPASRKVHKKANQPALPVEQLPAFVADLRTAPGGAARALEFGILCGSRSQEVRGALWSEIDLDAAVWTLAAARMKAGKEHRVPLSRRAVELLKAQAEKRPDGVDLVFPAGDKNDELSDATLLAVIKRMNKRREAEGLPLWTDPVQEGRPVEPHGFRSTFRVWARVNKYADDAAEAALAHGEENETVAAYKRGDHFDERVPMMAAWAKFCTGDA
jgi:integrase